ncbi:hypothetical protein [Ancylomarina euxinus]|nr:hypothetical protein [Ancylomarina euxinus]MCZ4693522.1 hypothetical protein [Ancylomarina euxinus]MUP13749.1 hypothetical protein [Ancylomarina euxinus]
MNIDIIKHVIFLGILLSLSSCIGTRSSQRLMSSPFAPTSVELQTSLNDYILVTNKEISIEYVSYLGVFRNIRKVNDSVFIPYKNKGVEINHANWKGIKSIFRFALTDLVEEYPDIDVFIPTYLKTESQDMFFGKLKKQTLKLKCYKYAH